MHFFIPKNAQFRPAAPSKAGSTPAAGPLLREASKSRSKPWPGQCRPGSQSPKEYAEISFFVVSAGKGIHFYFNFFLNSDILKMKGMKNARRSASGAASCRFRAARSPEAPLSYLLFLVYFTKANTGKEQMDRGRPLILQKKLLYRSAFSGLYIHCRKRIEKAGISRFPGPVRFDG